MKSTQLILAALVLFLAGGAAGSSWATLRWKAKIREEQNRRDQLATPMGYRLEFLRRAERDLNLSPDQRQRVEEHVRHGQERVRQLWDPVAPLVRKEFESVQDKIRSELNPEQLNRFEQILKERQRRVEARGEGRDRRQGGDTNRVIRPASPALRGPDSHPEPGRQ